MVKIVRVPGTASKNLEAALKNLDTNKVGKVGWFEGARYDPKPSNRGPTQPIHVAQVAAIQEYGAPSKNIPPRPFMRPTIIEKQNEWRDLAFQGAKAIIRGSYGIDEVLEKLGLKAAGDIRKKIASIFNPALAERTILARIARNSNLSKKKGRLSEKAIGGITKPLIDTGHMRDTLTNVVEAE